MKRLKVIVFLQKYRRIIWILSICVAILLVALFTRKMEIELAEINPTMFGVMGTLLGALIGGIFSLMGSVWVNSKQQRAVQNINRKNIIYSPLYDELMDIHYNILEKNPYPNYIAFEKGTQTYIPHPQFAVWKQIKADTRYLEVPDLLKKQMDQLESKIQAYQAIRSDVNDELKNILNSVLIENEQSPCKIINIGDAISSDILANKNVDIYHDAMEIVGEKILDEMIRKKINSQIFERAEKNPKVIEVRKCYNDWLDTQLQTIELLSLLIKQVIQKYEG
jgi:hypothetical protein